MPYGWKHGLWRDEDYGPPTRYRHSCRYRKKDRRLLYKKARNEGKRIIQEQIKEIN